jgi:hypothetical protein
MRGLAHARPFARQLIAEQEDFPTVRPTFALSSVIGPMPDNRSLWVVPVILVAVAGSIYIAFALTRSAD